MEKECYERLQTERESLNTKLQKLKLFINSSAFEALDKKDCALLYAQAGFMQNYLDVLDTRLERAIVGA